MFNTYSVDGDETHDVFTICYICLVAVMQIQTGYFINLDYFRYTDK